MSLLRLSCVASKIKERDLKIHFGKPENGGGTINVIMFPMFNDDAVIEFKEKLTAETVCQHTHSINGYEIYVKPLPVIQAFTSLTAKLDPTVHVLFQSDTDILDEIRHIGNLTYHLDDESNEATLTGNWYQLEWAWATIDRFMKNQKGLQKRISAKMNRDNESSAALPKGVRPVIGDQDSPIISLPSSSNDGEGERIDDDGDKNDNDEIEVVPQGSVHEMQRSANKVSRHGGTYDTNFLNQGETKTTETNSIVYIARAMADLNIHDKHVTFKESQDEKPLIQKHRDLKTTSILNDKPNDVRSLEFEHLNLVVNIFTGEITLAETDVIVNAAMGPLINAGGVAKAIARAAGPEMQRQCEEFVRKNGSLGISDVMHTCAGGSLNEKVKYIVHAVGPVWSSGADEDACKFHLTRTFLNCFDYGNNHLKVTSMTLPVISSGIFGCPLEVCVRAFVDAILLFTSKHEQETLHLREVHLINNNGDNTALTVVQVRQLIGQGFERLTLEASNFFKKMTDIEAASKVHVKIGHQNYGKGTKHRASVDPSGSVLGTAVSHATDHKGDKSQSRTADPGRQYSEKTQHRAGVDPSETGLGTAVSHCTDYKGDKSQLRTANPGQQYRARVDPSGAGLGAGVSHSKDTKGDESTPPTTGRPLPAVPTTAVNIKAKKK